MIICYFDGSCEPINPGDICSYGAIIYHSNIEIWRCSEIYTPKIQSQTSNNIAEYCGFGVTIRYIKNNDLDNKEVIIYGDSKLVIEQMSGNWKIKGGLYIPFAKRALEILCTFRKMPTLQWIPHEQNTIADELSKAQLLKQGIKSTQWKK